MKKTDLKDFLLSGRILNLLGKRKYFSLEDVHSVLPSRYSSLKQATLNHYLVDLMKQGNVHGAGRGWYSVIAQPFEADRTAVQELIALIGKKYPLLTFSSWSTEQLKMHMHHMLSKFVTFLFTDRDSMASVYDFLKDAGYDAWLNPRGKDAGRFVIGKKTVVIRPSISREPVDGHVARIEKILVDLLVEARELKLMDVEECYRVRSNVLESGRVDIATLLSYAKRRKLRVEKGSFMV